MNLADTLRYILIRRTLYPALAFLGACITASLSVTLVFFSFAITSGEAMGFNDFFSLVILTLFMAAYVAAFAAIPALVLIWSMRGLKAPRGWGDTLAGALTGGGLMHLIAFGLSGFAEPPVLNDLLFATAGGIGGLTYWYLAGRPKPPYNVTSP
jgi:ABC-type amino acid transport system permease subunit